MYDYVLGMSFILTLQYSSATPHINIYLGPFHLQHLPNWYCSPVLFSLTHAHTHSHKHFVNLVSSVVIYLCHLQPKMTPQERLKLRMQKALNKQCEYSRKCRNSSDLRACLNSPSLSPCVFLPVRRRVQDKQFRHLEPQGKFQLYYWSNIMLYAVKLIDRK